MGFWNKLGQFALQAAPYVAAPFTGGASLAFAPMTGGLANKLEDKADQAEYLKTGIAPSRNKMNSIMGGVNTAAGMYGGAKAIGGMMGKGGFGGDMSAGTPPINPGPSGGLIDFGRQQLGNQGTIGQIGQKVMDKFTRPSQQALNSPYQDARDFGGGGFRQRFMSNTQRRKPAMAR